MMDIIQKYLTEERDGVENLARMLGIVGAAQAKKSFCEDAIAQWTPERRIEEGLGVAIARWSQWGIEPILRVFINALEEANFHTFAGVVREELDKLEKEE